MLTAEDLDIYLREIHTIATEIGNNPSEVSALIVGACHLRGYDIVADSLSDLSDVQERSNAASKDIADAIREHLPLV